MNAIKCNNQKEYFFLGCNSEQMLIVTKHLTISCQLLCYRMTSTHLYIMLGVPYPGICFWISWCGTEPNPFEKGSTTERDWSNY